jgi:hypothetical protein
MLSRRQGLFKRQSKASEEAGKESHFSVRLLGETGRITRNPRNGIFCSYTIISAAGAGYTQTTVGTARDRES